MEPKWIKLDTKVFENPKLRLSIEPLKNRDTIYVIWFKLLCLAGLVCHDGYFRKSNGEPMLAKDFQLLFQRERKEIDQAIKIFLENNMLETAEDGCYLLTNWNEYQSIEKYRKQMEAKRAYDRERIAAIRHEKAKKNIKVVNEEQEPINDLDMSAVLKMIEKKGRG